MHIGAKLVAVKAARIVVLATLCVQSLFGLMLIMYLSIRCYEGGISGVVSWISELGSRGSALGVIAAVGALALWLFSSLQAHRWLALRQSAIETEYELNHWAEVLLAQPKGTTAAEQSRILATLRTELAHHLQYSPSQRAVTEVGHTVVRVVAARCASDNPGVAAALRGALRRRASDESSRRKRQASAA